MPKKLCNPIGRAGRLATALQTGCAANWLCFKLVAQSWQTCPTSPAGIAHSRSEATNAFLGATLRIHPRCADRFAGVIARSRTCVLRCRSLAPGRGFKELIDVVNIVCWLNAPSTGRLAVSVSGSPGRGGPARAEARNGRERDCATAKARWGRAASAKPSGGRKHSDIGRDHETNTRARVRFWLPWTCTRTRDRSSRAPTSQPRVRRPAVRTWMLTARPNP